MLDHTLQALLASLFTWGMTAAGAAVVIFFVRINSSVINSMLSLAAGVMTAASFWSLLAPAISLAVELRMNAWLVCLLGFLTGGAVLMAGDFFADRLCRIKSFRDTDKRSLMLVSSVTFHSIPEGLAVGVAFGSLAHSIEGATLAGAVLLAFGIGIQNLPEGMAVSVPLRCDGMKRGKAFFIGQLSGAVEPISAVLGALLTVSMRSLLPFMLSVAAGAMIYVVVRELVPESQQDSKKPLMAIMMLFGFSLMMVLDVALG